MHKDVEIRIQYKIMATIVPRQGPELDQDERVGLLAAQPYDKSRFWGVLAKTPQNGGEGGIPPKWPFWGVSPPSRGGSKNPVFGGPGGAQNGHFGPPPPYQRQIFSFLTLKEEL